MRSRECPLSTHLRSFSKEKPESAYGMEQALVNLQTVAELN